MDSSQIVQLSVTLILVAVVVVYSGKPGASHIAWAYHIGDQPLFRLLFLVAIMVVAQYSFPIAMMSVMLYMVINSMIPVLSQLDESFVWSGPQGSPLSACNSYSAESVKRVGTPFYPMHDNTAVQSVINAGNDINYSPQFQK